jgi:hypothetical protein
MLYKNVKILTEKRLQQKIDRFAYLMWQILIQIEPEQGYWQTKYWGDWTCDDESLICDKKKGKSVVFCKKKKKKKKWGRGRGGVF